MLRKLRSKQAQLDRDSNDLNIDDVLELAKITLVQPQGLRPQQVGQA